MQRNNNGITDDEIPSYFEGETLIETEEERKEWQRRVALEKIVREKAQVKTRSTLMRAKKGGRLSGGQKRIVEEKKIEVIENSIRFAQDMWEQKGPDPWDE